MLGNTSHHILNHIRIVEKEGRVCTPSPPSLPSPRVVCQWFERPSDASRAPLKYLVAQPAYLSVARSRKGKPCREALHAFKSIDVCRRETDQFADIAFGQEDTFNSVHSIILHEVSMAPWPEVFWPEEVTEKRSSSSISLPGAWVIGQRVTRKRRTCLWGGWCPAIVRVRRCGGRLIDDFPRRGRDGRHGCARGCGRDRGRCTGRKCQHRYPYEMSHRFLHEYGGHYSAAMTFVNHSSKVATASTISSQ